MINSTNSFYGFEMRNPPNRLPPAFRRIAHLLLTSPPSAEDDGYFPADAYDGLGTLEELEKIAQLQRKRIKRMMLEEKEMSVKHSTRSIVDDFEKH